MSRADAASILGVASDADAATVRRAFRMWALVAHPDAGGDRAHFAQLTQARRVMLRSAPRRPAPPSPAPAHVVPVRASLGAVLKVPAVAQLPVIVVGAAVALLVAAVPGMAPALSALLAGAASAAWAAAAARAVLRADADRGHRIAALAFMWLPLAALQLALSLVLGTQLALALPLLALPFAGVVAWVNTGAGLWRPIGPFDMPKS